jgi:GT2 family glycosyltransferase
MMNNDQIFDAGFLRYMLQTAEYYPRSVVGPLLLLWDQPHRLFQTSPVWNTWLGGWQHWNQQTVWTVPDKPWEVELIVGNCVLVPAASFHECGLMDSKHFPNFGDAEFTPRLRKNGWRLMIDPRARVFCQPNEIPPRVRKKKWLAFYRDLFVDLKNVHSLRRRWYAYLMGAPSKTKGIIAFFIFLVRIVAGRNTESISYSDKHPEPALRDTLKFAADRE